MPQCDYDVTISSTLLVDIFIFGLHLKSVQSALLKEGKDVTAEKALQVARTEKATRQQIEVIRSDRDKKLINCVTKKGQHSTPPGHSIPKPLSISSRTPNTKKCGNCGLQHDKGACPAKGTRCNSCGKMNHWSKICHSSTTPSKPTARRTRARVHETQAQEPPTVDELYFHSVQVDTISSSVSDNTSICQP